MSTSLETAGPRNYSSLTYLTIGIEFEFYVHSNAIGMPQAEVDDLKKRSVMVPAQRFAQAATFVKSSILDTLALDHQVEVSNSIEAEAPRSINENTYRTWIVTTDSALTPILQGNTLPWLGIEVKTPVMELSGPTYRQIDRVGKALKDSAYTGFDNNCGLHVHIGHGPHGFSLLTCQKLFSVLFLGGEYILDALFRSTRHNNRNCLPMWQHARVVSNPHDRFFLSGEVPTDWFNRCFPEGGLPVHHSRREAVRKVWRAGNVHEFHRALNVGYRHAVTFQHLTQDSKPTIEFRKAEGNLRLQGETGFLVAWPRVCAQLVAFAVNADLDEFARVMAGMHVALNYPTAADRVRHFLRVLRMPDYTTEWLAWRTTIVG